MYMGTSSQVFHHRYYDYKQSQHLQNVLACISNLPQESLQFTDTYYYTHKHHISEYLSGIFLLVFSSQSCSPSTLSCFSFRNNHEQNTMGCLKKGKGFLSRKPSTIFHLTMFSTHYLTTNNPESELCSVLSHWSSSICSQSKRQYHKG